MANLPAGNDEDRVPVSRTPAQGAGASRKDRSGVVRPLFIVPLLAVALIAWIWWSNHTQEVPGTAGGQNRGRSANGPLPVVAELAKKQDVNIYLDNLGTVSPLVTVTVRSQISGQLIQVNFKEGQSVKRGEVLAIIDSRPYQNALHQAQGQLLEAQAQLKEAQLNLERYQTLSKQDSISQQQVDTQSALVAQYEGVVRVDQAAIDAAKLNLAYCNITAPASGRLGLRQIDPGNYVTVGDAGGLVVLTQTKPISVVFPLPEDDITEVVKRIRSGAILPVTVFDRTETTELAQGALETTDNEVDPSTGTFKLRAIFANDDESLFPNQFVNVRMLLDVDKDAIVIPTSAIERGETGDFVYVVKPDSTVASRRVKLGPAEGERQAIASGLEVGERVVTDGADKLKEGMAVIVQTPEQAAAGASAVAPTAAASLRPPRNSGAAGNAAK